MLETIQIIAIIQGLFLLIVLFKNRKKYIFANYFYFNAALISLLLFLLGDDNSNLLLSNSDFFFVDNTLFITFLFLFLKNFSDHTPIKLFKILPYFIPVVLYLLVEFYEIYYSETHKIEIVEHILYFTFIIYLVLAFYYTLKIPAKTVIKIPFFILIFSLFIEYSFDIIMFLTNSIIPAFIDSVLILEIAIVFYYLTYLLVFNTNFIAVPVDTGKYKNSSLNENAIQLYISTMENIMESDQLFLDSDLSLQSFSEKTAIPKHFISEVLNVHLNKTFTQFVNEYRIQEFIKLYTNDENNQFSILGIANSVGFKNKATFNTAFKKITGLSPSDYKKEVYNN